jgi:hypothetical protein
MVVVLFGWSFSRLRGLPISDLNAPRHFDTSVGFFGYWQCWNQLKLVCSQRKKEKQAGCRRLTPEIRDADSMEGDS